MVIDFFEAHGYPKGIFTLNDLIFEMVRKAELYFLEQGFDPQIVEKTIADVNKIVISVEEENIPNATIVEGMPEILDYLSQNHIRMSICTFNTTPVAIQCLKKVGIITDSESIDEIPQIQRINRKAKGWILSEHVFGRDKAGKKAKPDPFHYQLTLNALGVTGNETLVIGDHPKDILGAKAIDARSIAIIREGYKPEMFETDLYVLQAEIPQKLLKIIKNLLE